MDSETSAGLVDSMDEGHSTKKPNADLEALLAELEQQRIAAVAYFLWQQRGCPHGSSDDDWFQAKQLIRDA